MKRFFLAALAALTLACGQEAKPTPCEEPTTGFEMSGLFSAHAVVYEDGEVLYDGMRFLEVIQAGPAAKWFGALGFNEHDRIVINEQSIDVFDVAGGWNYVVYYDIVGESYLDNATVYVNQTLRKAGEIVEESRLEWRIDDLTRLQDPYDSDARVNRDERVGPGRFIGRRIQEAMARG